MRCAFPMALAGVVGGLSTAAPAAAETIRQIRVADNTKTTDETVRYLAGIEEGDTWYPDMREEIRIELVSSGLFKEVDVASEPHPKGGVIVTLFAQDKHSWAVAPTYYDQPTNRGAGAGFGESNLFGRNKKLLLYGQIATGDTFFVGAYVDPSVAGTPFKWQLDVFLRRERVNEYAPDDIYLPQDISSREPPIIAREQKMNYLNTGLKFGVELFRAFSLEARVRSAWVSYTKPDLGQGASEEMVAGDLPVGCVEEESCELPKPGVAGWDTSVEAIAEFDRVANWYGVASGNRVTASLEKSIPPWSPIEGRDAGFDYWYSGLRYLGALRFLGTANLVLRSEVWYGRNLPFQHEFTSGGPALRGYKNRQFRGDFKAGLNVEQSFQLFNIRGFALRLLGFVDSTYTAFLSSEKNQRLEIRHYLPGHDAFDENRLVPWRNSVGIGTRVYIRQIVLPLLGLDLGYGLESGGFEIYLAIGLTDY